MNAINLKRFVDIDIKRHTAAIANGVRDTAVIFSDEVSENYDRTFRSYLSMLTEFGMSPGQGEQDPLELLNLQVPLILEYAKIFFDNGGIALRIIHADFSEDRFTVEHIKALANEYIVCAFCMADRSEDMLMMRAGDDSAGPDDFIASDGNYEFVKSLANAMNADESVYGINEKLLLAYTLNPESIPTDSVKNMIVKYGYAGAEMTIAAYLTQINVYKANSIFDYAFTEEAIQPVPLTDQVFAELELNNINVDYYLANAVRNLGGNCKDGADVTNTYVRIILHQTVTEQLLAALTEKVKGSSGISKIYTAIVQELNNYVTNGYLTTDKIWTDNDLSVVYNGETYDIITKGTALVEGYLVKILPYTALSSSDKAARKTPPIYIILADQYGIRQITINGEVI